MWHAKSATGRRLPYALHVWKGKADGKPAKLTFDEIPGTTGPNYHLKTNLKRIPAKIDWRAKRDFVFVPRIIMGGGPLAGEWTATNCETRQPAGARPQAHARRLTPMCGRRQDTP